MCEVFLLFIKILGVTLRGGNFVHMCEDFLFLRCWMSSSKVSKPSVKHCCSTSATRNLLTASLFRLPANILLLTGPMLPSSITRSLTSGTTSSVLCFPLQVWLWRLCFPLLVRFPTSLHFIKSIYWPHCSGGFWIRRISSFLSSKLRCSSFQKLIVCPRSPWVL